MSDWTRCRDLSDGEMEDILLQYFPPGGKEYWKIHKPDGKSYLMRQIIPTFSFSVPYPGELRAVVFICWEDRKQRGVLPPSDLQYGGLLTQDDLNSLDEKLNAIGAGFEQQ